MSNRDNIDDITRSLQVRTVDEDETVATIVDYEDKSERYGRVNITYEMPNNQVYTHTYNVPPTWHEKHDWVRFVEWENAPWSDEDQFLIDDVSDTDIKVSKEDGSWEPAIPEYTEPKEERIKSKLSKLEMKEILIGIMGMIGVLATVVVTALLVMEIVGVM